MNKKFLKLKLSINGSHYVLTQYGHNAKALDYLRRFLTSDVQYNDSKSWKRLISGLKDNERTAGNISFLDRVGDTIIISNSIDDDPNPITCEISIANLLEILDQWEQLCKERPQEIWIFEENGKVWLEGKN